MGMLPSGMKFTKSLTRAVFYESEGLGKEQDTTVSGS